MEDNDDKIIHGKWLTNMHDVDGSIKCSACGVELDKYILGGKLPDFCICGAKMDQK